MSNPWAKTLGAGWVAMSDIKKADEMAKNPPIFKKLFAAGSVEEEVCKCSLLEKSRGHA